MRAVVLVAAVFVTGCLAPEAEPLTSASLQPAAGAPAAIDLSGAACWLGGGHSVLPKYDFVLPEPWMPADILEDVGPQLVYSSAAWYDDSPVPSEGRTMGNWHASLVCEDWTFRGEARPGMLLGFVGARVEPPPFDEAARPADRHYLATVAASDDPDVVAAFAAAGLPAMQATFTRDDLPGGALRLRMATDANGAYDVAFLPKEMGATPERLRVWYQASDEPPHGHGGDLFEPETQVGGEFRPVALDIVTSGGTHLAADATGYFSHSGTEHHAPLPGAYSNSAAVLHEGLDVRLEWGPRPDVVLDAAYVH